MALETQQNTESESGRREASDAERLVMPDHKYIYLLPDEDGAVWCDDPAPGIGMDEADAIPYVRLDIAKAAINEAVRRPMGVVPDIADEILKA